MHWGRSMLLLYVVFIGVILFMVVKSFGHESELVTDDYYAEELKYQERIDAEANALPFKDSVEIRVAGGIIEIQFPSACSNFDKGEAYFYKASDKHSDIVFPLQPDNGRIQKITREQLGNGFYTVKLSWYQGEKKFFMERNIYL